MKTANHYSIEKHFFRKGQDNLAGRWGDFLTGLMLSDHPEIVQLWSNKEMRYGYLTASTMNQIFYSKESHSEITDKIISWFDSVDECKALLFAVEQLILFSKGDQDQDHATYSDVREDLKILVVTAEMNELHGKAEEMVSEKIEKLLEA